MEVQIMEQNSTQILLSVNQFAEKNPAFTKGCLRALIFNAEKNGFNKVIRRIGGRIFINQQDFFKWVDEINGVHNKTEFA